MLSVNEMLHKGQSIDAFIYNYVDNLHSKLYTITITRFVTNTVTALKYGLADGKDLYYQEKILSFQALEI